VDEHVAFEDPGLVFDDELGPATNERAFTALHFLLTCIQAGGQRGWRIVGYQASIRALVVFSIR
jgi:hypothetical protein